MKFKILGCGSSMGVPRSDGDFGNCDPKEIKNYRTRCSALIIGEKINILTFERGVGITEACGSGAGASAFASRMLNYCNRKIEVCMKGGNLIVEITKDKHILTIGDAKEVFNGTIELEDIILNG